MAIGFLPKFSQELILTNITREHFIVVAHEALIKTGWKPAHYSPTGIIANTGIRNNTKNAEIRIVFGNGRATFTSISTNGEIADGGSNKRNILLYIENFSRLLGIITIEQWEAEYLELTKLFPTEKIDKVLVPAENDIHAIRALFIPTKGYFITPLLVYANLAVFIAMLFCGINFFDPELGSMLDWGASYKPLIVGGGEEYYRLLTNFFLHFGVVHLVLNMFALVYIGIILEPLLGKARFLSAYILCGFLASVASLWFNDLVVSAGASGAIFGMYGAFAALLSTRLIEKSARKDLITCIAIFIALNIFSGITDSGIDNSAHIGGLAGGIITGYLFVPGLLKPDNTALKYGSIALCTCLTIVLCCAACTILKRV